MPNSLHKKTLLYCAILIIAACAQVVTPTGGPKDTTPPKVLKSVPGNFETNYTGNKLILYFDEFVTIKDASSEIIISPLIGGNPKVKTKGKSVEIIFDTLPQPNTTYTVYLRKSISDFTEGNILDSNLFVFSTGNSIDTLYLKGKITDTEWGKPEPDMFIMLYTDTSDSVPLKHRPYYLTQSDENGNFKLLNLKNGIYRLFALKDLNSNYLFDLPDEKIAFAPKLIQLDNNLDSVMLFAFKEASEKQFIKSAEFVQFGKIQIIFNLPVNNIQIAPLNFQFKKPWFLMESNSNNDSLNVWLTDFSVSDSLILEIKDNEKILDTLELAIPAKPSEKDGVKGGRGSGKMASFELKAQINATSNMPLNYNDSLILTWNHPITSIDFNKIFLKQGNDTLPIKIETIDNALRKQSVIFNKTEDSTYHLWILPHAVEDIFGLKNNDTINLSFKTQKKDYYGTIVLTVDGLEKTTLNYIIDLIDEKNQIIKTKYTHNLKNIKFDYLAPANYSFRLIVDENNNKKWDTGNYLAQKQPEKVYIYTNSIAVKGNWESEITWLLP